MSFKDHERTELMDTIKKEGKEHYKFSTPMADPKKLPLFLKAPTEQDLGRYAIDLDGIAIIRDDRKTLSTAHGKKRGQSYPPNAKVTYEYSESCFHCGRTDQIMKSHERTNVREVMRNARWMT